MVTKVKILNDETASSMFPFDEARNDMNTSTRSDVHHCKSHFCPLCTRTATATTLQPSFIAVPKTLKMRRLPSRWWEAEDMQWEEVAKAALALICPALDEDGGECNFCDDATISSESSILCPPPSELSHCFSTAWSFISDDDDGAEDPEVPFDEPSPRHH